MWISRDSESTGEGGGGRLGDEQRKKNICHTRLFTLFHRSSADITATQIKTPDVGDEYLAGDYRY